MAEVALESSAFRKAEAIPRRHTCEGEDMSPPLRWADVPEGTRSLALIVDDPDAPGGVFTHWVAWGLAPEIRGLDEGEQAPKEGRNDFGATGYRGPCPPPGHGRHRYVFRLFALDAEPKLAAGASSSAPTSAKASAGRAAQTRSASPAPSGPRRSPAPSPARDPGSPTPAACATS
jgi:Raf kinase inhibitor-like YbhB/YbcL family protein